MKKRNKSSRGVPVKRKAVEGKQDSELSQPVETLKISAPDLDRLKIREGVERLVELATSEPTQTLLPSVTELAFLASLNRGEDGRPDFPAAWDVWVMAVDQICQCQGGSGEDPYGAALRRIAELVDADDPELAWGSEDMAKIVGGRYPDIRDEAARGEGIFDCFEKRVCADFPEKAREILAPYHGARGNRPGILRSVFLRYWTKESGVARRKMKRERGLDEKRRGNTG